MKPVDLDFELPDWDIPPSPRTPLDVNAWLDWLDENYRELVRTGEIEKIRKDPLRCPVDAPFKL